MTRNGRPMYRIGGMIVLAAGLMFVCSGHAATPLLNAGPVANRSVRPKPIYQKPQTVWELVPGVGGQISEIDIVIDSCFGPVNEPTDVQAKIEQAEAEIRKKLETRVTVPLKAKTLDKVIKELAVIGKFPCLIDEPALTDEAISLSEKIRPVPLKKPTVRQVLDFLLTPRGLTWVIQDEVLKVTTLGKHEEMLTIRVYPIGGLLHPKVKTKSPVLDFDESLPIRRISAPARDPNDVTTLIDLIQEETSASWFENSAGSISALETADVLVIRQTRKMHAEVSELLRGLGVAAEGKLRTGSIVVRWPHYPHDQDAAIRRALANRMSFKYRGEKLSAVVADLQKRSGATIIVDEPALKDEGVELDDSVKLDVKGVTLQSALRMIGEPRGLTFFVHDGYISITTIQKADEILYAVVYGVRDLFENGVQPTQLEDVLQQETSGSWVETNGSGGAISIHFDLGVIVVRQTAKVHTEIKSILQKLRSQQLKTAERRKREPKKKLDPNAYVIRFYPAEFNDKAISQEKAIRAFVAPQSWTAKDSQAKMQIIEGTLVVRQTVKVHHEIHRFLNQLEKAETQQQGGSGRGDGRGFF